MTIPGIYTQRDSRWSNNELGYNNDPAYNLYHYGCLITAVANLLWYVGDARYDPGTVNTVLQQRAGFVPGGGNMIWQVADEIMAEDNIVAQGYSTDLGAVNQFLADDNNYAIVWITKPGFPQHWSVMPFVGLIADSWDGVLKPVTDYMFRGAYLFAKVTPVIPPPVVASPPLIPPTIVAPTPDPVPTNTEPQSAPQNVVAPTPLEAQPVDLPPAPEPVTTAPVTAPATEPVTTAPPVMPAPEPTTVAPVAFKVTLLEPPSDESLTAEGIVYDLDTGFPLERVPAGTTRPIWAVAEKDGRHYLQTQKMVQNGQHAGIPVEAFNLKVTSSSKASINDVSWIWKPIINVLHFLSGHKERIK